MAVQGANCNFLQPEFLLVRKQGKKALSSSSGSRGARMSAYFGFKPVGVVKLTACWLGALLSSRPSSCPSSSSSPCSSSSTLAFGGGWLRALGCAGGLFAWPSLVVGFEPWVALGCVVGGLSLGVAAGIGFAPCVVSGCAGGAAGAAFCWLGALAFLLAAWASGAGAALFFDSCAKSSPSSSQRAVMPLFGAMAPIAPATQMEPHGYRVRERHRSCDAIRACICLLAWSLEKTCPLARSLRKRAGSAWAVSQRQCIGDG